MEGTPNEKELIDLLARRSIDRAAEILPEMIKIYEDIHENPELGGQEIETSRKICEYLTSLGIEIVGRDIGLNHADIRDEKDKKDGFSREAYGTGVVAIIHGREGGKTIAIRADMDALPMQEDAKNPIKSKIPGKMHACGHDIHTTSLLGTAKVLKELADNNELPGDVVLVFQPSEEKTHQKESGAVQMIKFLQRSGLRERIDAFLGQHVMAAKERGNVSIREGIQSSSSGEIDIKLEGSGGHVINIYEDEIPNLNVIFAEITSRLHDVFKPLYQENKSIVANTRTDFNKGGYNVIPSSGESTFVVRVSDENYRPIAQEIQNKIKSVVQEVVDEYAKGKVKVTISPRMGYRPIVHRDASLVKLAREVAAQVLEKPVFDDEFMPGGEDFSFYLEELRGKQIPGAFMIVGGVNPEKGIPKTAHHSPKFRIDPDVLKEMAGINVAFVIDFLSKNEEVLS